MDRKVATNRTIVTELCIPLLNGTVAADLDFGSGFAVRAAPEGERHRRADDRLVRDVASYRSSPRNPLGSWKSRMGKLPRLYVLQTLSWNSAYTFGIVGTYSPRHRMGAPVPE
jgi:hypothetical protein